MIYFSYNDYSDCMENGKIDEIKKVEEKVAKYELKNGKIKKTENDNNVIKILKEKYELKKFLNEFLKLDLSQLGNSPLIKYYNYTKTILDKEKESTLIAKIEEKQIFILVKEINEIDTNISYKMFEHTFNIIKRWNEEEKKENKRNPIVIPIVIYTGKEKWKDFNHLYSRSINYTTWKENEIKFFYNMIQVNELKLKNLEQINSKISEEFIEIKNKYLQIN